MKISPTGEISATIDAHYYLGYGSRGNTERPYVAQNWDGTQITGTLTQNNAGGESENAG